MTTSVGDNRRLTMMVENKAANKKYTDYLVALQSLAAAQREERKALAAAQREERRVLDFALLTRPAAPDGEAKP